MDPNMKQAWGRGRKNYYLIAQKRAIIYLFGTYRSSIMTQIERPPDIKGKVVNKLFNAGMY